MCVITNSYNTERDMEGPVVLGPCHSVVLCGVLVPSDMVIEHLTSHSVSV